MHRDLPATFAKVFHRRRHSIRQVICIELGRQSAFKEEVVTDIVIFQCHVPHILDLNLELACTIVIARLGGINTGSYFHRNGVLHLDTGTAYQALVRIKNNNSIVLDKVMYRVLDKGRVIIRIPESPIFIMHTEMGTVAIKYRPANRNTAVFKLPFDIPSTITFRMDRKTGSIVIWEVCMRTRQRRFLATEIVADGIPVDLRIGNIPQTHTRLQNFLVIETFVTDKRLDFAFGIFKSRIPCNRSWRYVCSDKGEACNLHSFGSFKCYRMHSCREIHGNVRNHSRTPHRGKRQMSRITHSRRRQYSNICR